LGAKNKTVTNRNSCAEKSNTGGILGIMKNTEFQEYETGILKQKFKT
jgi:hypothetical protein